MKRVRFLSLAALLGAVALYAGLRVGSFRAVHPLTGRPIAGIATNAAWMDRASREKEEAPAKAVAMLDLHPAWSSRISVPAAGI